MHQEIETISAEEEKALKIKQAKKEHDEKQHKLIEEGFQIWENREKNKKDAAYKLADVFQELERENRWKLEEKILATGKEIGRAHV